MKRRSTPISHRTPLQMSAMALALGTSLGVHAQTAPETASPWSVGASVGVVRDNNVLRSSDNSVTPPRSDTITTTGLQAGLDVPFGRQRFYADASLRDSRYANTDSLNSSGYGLRVGLDWSTIERLSGNLRLSSDRTPSSVNPGDAPALTRSNLETADEADFRIRFGLVSTLALEGGLNHRRVNYSAPEFAFREFTQNAGSLGVRYRPSDLLNAGVFYRATKGKYPLYSPDGGTTITPDALDRKDIDLTAAYRPTGASTLNARLSYTKSDYLLTSSRDFSGVTGDLSWMWQPTGRLSLTSSLSRDTGEESGFLAAPTSGAVPGVTGTPGTIGTIGTVGSSVGSDSLRTDTSRLVNSVGVTASYLATGKITLNAGWRHDQRSLVNTQSGIVLAGKDRTNIFSVGASWAATRTINLGCNAGREDRRSDGVLSDPYSADFFGCTGQITLP